MQIAVFGSGYVGLVTSACLANLGNRVVCVDIDETRINRLLKGDLPIFEPGLADMLEGSAKQGRITFTTNAASALDGANLVFSAVGTPPRDDGAAKLASVDKVAEVVAAHATQDLTLLLKSTVPVGTNRRVRNIVSSSPHRIEVVSNPEFLKEGDAIADFMRPDRIVVGIRPEDTASEDRIKLLFHPVCLGGERFVWMSPESAELTKYVANTMLAMRISFMNEVAALCEATGADVNEVRVGVGSDTRIGPKFLFAGPGYGGSCFPKDVKALVHTGHEHGVHLELAMATDRVNQRQRGIIGRKLRAALGGELRGKQVAVWGLTFKPRTDDIRESAALTLIETLLDDGAHVSAHDPEGMDNARKLFGDRVHWVEDAYQAAEGADALVLVTEWREYQTPDFARLLETMRGRVLVDGRNIWHRYDPKSQGFHYTGIGTAAPKAMPRS